MIRIALAASSLWLAACSQAEAPAADPRPPATETPDAAATPGVPAGLEAWLRAQHADDGDLRFTFATVDLNGDGTDEVLAYVVGPMVCGSGGCNLHVLARDGDGWRGVTITSVTQTPIGVLPTSTDGWRDLAVSVGGGGAPAGWVRLTWNGATYPTNPTTVDAAEPDAATITTLIASDPEFLPLP